MIMLDIAKIRPSIAALCRRLRVRRLDLFGSAATDEFGADSDVDVLVEFDREPGDLFNRSFELKEQLEIIFGRPVHVVVENAIRNPYFKVYSGKEEEVVV